MSDLPTPSQTGPAAEPEIHGSVILRSWPKIIMMWPTLIMSIACAIVMSLYPPPAVGEPFRMIHLLNLVFLFVLALNLMLLLYDLNLWGFLVLVLIMAVAVLAVVVGTRAESPDLRSLPLSLTRVRIPQSSYTEPSIALTAQDHVFFCGPLGIPGGNIGFNRTADWKTFTRVNIIEASPHDAGTAYLAANRYQLDDFRPFIFKTADYGRTWQAVASGIPERSFVRTVREDPNRKGLLFAGTETGVYYSPDGGAQWQSLQLNLPVVPITDLAIRNGDLVAATQGRAFWVLDDVTPLRQLGPEVAAAGSHLFKPQTAVRVRRSVNTDTYRG